MHPLADPGIGALLARKPYSKKAGVPKWLNKLTALHYPRNPPGRPSKRPPKYSTIVPTGVIPVWTMLHLSTHQIILAGNRNMLATGSSARLVGSLRYRPPVFTAQCAAPQQPVPSVAFGALFGPVPATQHHAASAGCCHSSVADMAILLALYERQKQAARHAPHSWPQRRAHPGCTAPGE